MLFWSSTTSTRKEGMGLDLRSFWPAGLADGDAGGLDAGGWGWALAARVIQVAMAGAPAPGPRAPLSSAALGMP